MNDKVAMAEGGRGISKDRLFVRAHDIKISLSPSVRQT
jgi:hypothetical protein